MNGTASVHYTNGMTVPYYTVNTNKPSMTNLKRPAQRVQAGVMSASSMGQSGRQSFDPLTYLCG
jgi:hypothetical protein